jgi:hypothetical protein
VQSKPGWRYLHLIFTWLTTWNTVRNQDSCLRAVLRSMSARRGDTLQTNLRESRGRTCWQGREEVKGRCGKETLPDIPALNKKCFCYYCYWISKFMDLVHGWRNYMGFGSWITNFTVDMKLWYMFIIFSVSSTNKMPLYAINFRSEIRETRCHASTLSVVIWVSDTYWGDTCGGVRDFRVKAFFFNFLKCAQIKVAHPKLEPLTLL